MKVLKLTRQFVDEHRKWNLPSLDVWTAESALCGGIVDPRTAPDDVRNIWKEVVEAVAALIYVHRDVDAANDWAVLDKSAVRISPMMLHSVAMARSESGQRSVESGEVFSEAVVIFDSD
jgi:hypothetical protein